MTMVFDSYLRRDGNVLNASNIQRHGNGGFLVQPPGGVERVRVAANRPDIAVMLASGAVKPPPSRSATCADAPARVTLTRTDINVIGDAVGMALRERDRRITALELASGALSVKGRRILLSRGRSNFPTRLRCVVVV